MPTFAIQSSIYTFIPNSTLFMLKVFHSDRFIPQLPPGHRFPIEKYGLIREQLLYEGSLEADQLEESFPVDVEDILRVHEQQYWDKLATLSLDPKEGRRLGFPQSDKLVDRSRRSVQGTLSAAHHALQHKIGMNIAGGTHHAYPDHGEGFCVLNDIAITIRHLQTHDLIKKALIIDLDVHQGDANAYIFQDDPSVFTFSMHGKDNYPLRKQTSDWDVPLETDLRDEAYLDILENALKDLNKIPADIIFFQAGVDVLETDRLGKLSLSKAGCKQRDQMAITYALDRGIPLCVCIGGGYSRKIGDTVEGHANTFRVAKDVFHD